jgi:SAM-dependent methyltransferase
MNIVQVLRAFPKAKTFSDFNVRQRNAWVEEVARELPSGTHILDVGAGPAPYRSLFNHCVYETHDFAQYQGTQHGLQKDEWGYSRLDYISDITSIPVADASFDAILCTEVLEHVPEPIQAIHEMTRILKPGGRLFISAPLASGLHQMPFHFYGGYTPPFYQKFLTECNCEVNEIRPNGGFFKHYAQESARVGWALQHHRKWGKFAPQRYIVGLVFQRIFPIIFFHLDDSVRVDEFTVGYFVKATKQKEDTL